jgi:chromosome segregation ATPase
MKRTIACAPLALSLALLAACSSDPNKKVKQAEWNAIEERGDERVDAIERERKMRDQRIEERKDVRENAADRAHAGDPAREDLQEATIEMSAERQKFRSDARARVQKLDARVDALRAKLQSAGPRATTEARDSLGAVASQRSLVETQLDQLGRARNDQWKAARDGVSARIDELDRIVDEAARKINALKP